MISIRSIYQHRESKYIVELIAALFILLFVYTASSKLMEQEKFRIILSFSPLLHSWAGFLAWLLPIAELTTATLLFFPATRISGLLFSLGLMVIFSLYLSYMILSNEHLPCSCGGVLSILSWRQHLVLNFIFIGLALTAVLIQQEKFFIAINRRSRKPATE